MASSETMEIFLPWKSGITVVGINIKNVSNFAPHNLLDNKTFCEEMLIL